MSRAKAAGKESSVTRAVIDDLITREGSGWVSLEPYPPVADLADAALDRSEARTVYEDDNEAVRVLGRVAIKQKSGRSVALAVLGTERRVQADELERAVKSLMSRDWVRVYEVEHENVNDNVTFRHPLARLALATAHQDYLILRYWDADWHVEIYSAGRMLVRRAVSGRKTCYAVSLSSAFQQ